MFFRSKGLACQFPEASNLFTNPQDSFAVNIEQITSNCNRQSPFLLFLVITQLHEVGCERLINSPLMPPTHIQTAPSRKGRLRDCCGLYLCKSNAELEKAKKQSPAYFNERRQELGGWGGNERTFVVPHPFSYLPRLVKHTQRMPYRYLRPLTLQYVYIHTAA